MQLAFFPVGALLAVAVLGATLAVFGLALNAMDRAYGAARSSMLPSLVAGLRDWAPPSMAADPGSPGALAGPLVPPRDARPGTPSAATIEEVASGRATLEWVLPSTMGTGLRPIELPGIGDGLVADGGASVVVAPLGAVVLVDD